jgi:hypothetical protein
MTFVRVILLLASAAGAVFSFVVALDAPRYRQEIAFFGFLASALFCLNISYLFLAGPPPRLPSTRVGRLYRLWMDAKERELEERATRTKQPGQ